jgi:hypothetical protein
LPQWRSAPLSMGGQPRNDEWKVSLGFFYKRQTIPHVNRKTIMKNNYIAYMHPVVIPTES